MLHLEDINPCECELCAQRREQEPECELCYACYLKFENYKLLKQEILDLRDHELAVSRAAGVVPQATEYMGGPILRDIVLQAVKKHKAAWEQAQTIKRLFDVVGRKPIEGKDPEQWLEQTLDKIEKLEKKVLSKLTPKEKEVLKKRFPKP